MGMVLGYMYFGSPTYGAQHHEFQKYFWNPFREADLPQRVFPRRLSERGYFDFVFTDLNRQLPYSILPSVVNWVTPDDPEQRWGSNHLYERYGWPKGSHVANRDGSVTWTNGEDLEMRVNYTASSRANGFFW